MAKAAKGKDIGDELACIIGENDDEATVTQFLDTGFPVLNDASASSWSAGLPVGRMIEIAGPPSSGKTAIATAAMEAAQKAGGIAGFMDHERSFSSKVAQKIGLDVSRGRFVYKTPKTFEESIAYFQLAVKTIRERKLIADDAPICWVFDSLAAMVPQSVLLDAKTGKNRSAEDRNMNDNTALARATSSHFPVIAMLAQEYNACVIFLNQLRTKIGVMYGDPRKTTGGDSAAYYFSQRLWLSSKQIKKGDEVIGVEVTGKFVKNKVARPFKEATWFFMFEQDGTGHFDREKSMVEFLASQGTLPVGTVKGSVIWSGKQYPKSVLAAAIRESGQFDLLKSMLPTNYNPEVTAHIKGQDSPDDELEAA